MWPFTQYLFYSAVCTRQGDGSHGNHFDSNRIMVEAWARQHLEPLQKCFPNLLQECDIMESSSLDDAFRIETNLVTVSDGADLGDVLRQFQV